MMLRVSYVLMLVGMGGFVYCESSEKSLEQQCPLGDGNMVDPEKLEAIIKKLMGSLKNEGYSEEEIMTRLQREVDGKIDLRSYQEIFRDTCGAGPLVRCAREFKPIAGHICENTEPIEPRGPFCNCPFCGEKEELKKEVRDVDFEENEAMKAESAKSRQSASVYNDKWALNAKLAPQMIEDKKLKSDSIESSMDDLPPRSHFSCQKTDSIYDIERAPIGGDPEFQEQLKTVLEEEQQPSLGILKYHRKRSSEEGDL